MIQGTRIFMFWNFLMLVSTVDIVMGENSYSAVDISHFQDDPDFQKVVESGIEIVIHKATQGESYTDPKFNERMVAARKAGVKYWGAYHFADGTDGEKQAQHFLQVAGNASFLAVDFEDNPSQEKGTVDLEKAENLVSALFKSTGRLPFVYGGAYFLDKWADSSVIAQCPLWVASWRDEPLLPRMWKDWVLWQYTDGTNGPDPHCVPGIGCCDREMVNMTAFRQYVD